jgi:hypothetical protein
MSVLRKGLKKAGENPGRFFFQRGTFFLPAKNSSAHQCDSPEHLYACIQWARTEFVRETSQLSIGKPWKWPIQLSKILILYFRLKSTHAIATALLDEQKLLDKSRGTKS